MTAAEPDTGTSSDRFDEHDDIRIDEIDAAGPARSFKGFKEEGAEAAFQILA